MPNSKKRKKTQVSNRNRHNKALYLPLDRASVDQMAIGFRIALESIRQGRGETIAARCMVQVVLLTSYVSDAGYGFISSAALDEAEDLLFDVFGAYNTTGKWIFEPSLIDKLTAIVNEHERQLRETRLQIIVGATRQLNRLLESSTSDADLFRSKRS
jgi:hypothetical protein